MFDNLMQAFSDQVSDQLQQLSNKLAVVDLCSYQGKVQSAVGTIIIAHLPRVKIGDLCLIEDPAIKLQLYAEVIALDGDLVKLLPFGSIDNISNNAVVNKLSANFAIKISGAILGKIVDGIGNVTGDMVSNRSALVPFDGDDYAIMSYAPDPLTRKLIDEPLVTGVKAIDMFTTCGKGQRIAIFAGPGMGKTTLMGMIIRNSKVDVIVVALIGERGREVREFIELELDEPSRKKCVCVVVTSDRPPVEQVKAAYVAQTIAEYFRDQGKSVLLFVDSMTRFARAQREVGLSAGEPATRGGFPPSVFLAFPRLMERAGNNQLGSITAFYTVLMEGEQTNQDPVADEIRSIVDGHILLSKKLAEAGQFPAVNILTSLSRVADRIISKEHLLSARKLRQLLSKYEELEFLLHVGEYKKGNDALADEAISKHGKIMQLLKQNTHELADFNNTLVQMRALGG